MLKIFAGLLSPFAPFLADEMWERLGGVGRLAFSKWPEYDPKDVVAGAVSVVVQVNGKKRAEIRVAPGSPDIEALARAAAEKWLEGGVKKTIVVPDKIVNFVV
jgi:leucyl-tRNA synthetase